MVDKPVTLSGNCPTDNANGLPCRGQDRKVSWGLSSKRTYLGLTGSWVGCRLDPPCRGQQIKHSQTPVRGQRDREQDHHPMMQTNPTPTDSKHQDELGVKRIRFSTPISHDINEVFTSPETMYGWV